MSEWQPIETAPLDKRVLLWWIPVNNNPYAECAVFGEVSSHESGMYWCGATAAYKELERITHWMPAPERPSSRVTAV